MRQLPPPCNGRNLEARAPPPWQGAIVGITQGSTGHHRQRGSGQTCTQSMTLPLWVVGGRGPGFHLWGWGQARESS